MQYKFFEIRDAATFIPALVIFKEANNEKESYLLRRSGFLNRCMILIKLQTGESSYDPHKWTMGRTMTIAHRYIIDHFDSLENGQVIDVEYILGRRDKPKESEQNESYL